MDRRRALIIELSKDFKKSYIKTLERYNFDVGVLEDKPHYEAEYNSINEEPSLKQYAGGPARKQSRIKSGKTVGEVLVDNMKRLQINFVLDPFKRKSEPLTRFTESFLKLAYGDGEKVRRVENLLQALIRNPILKREYGDSKSSTSDAKGFNRPLIDTSQMFRAIRAKVNNAGK